jgi:hypothetical protein
MTGRFTVSNPSSEQKDEKEMQTQGRISQSSGEHPFKGTVKFHRELHTNS